MGYSWGQGCIVLWLHKQERKEWWHLRNFEKNLKKKNVNKLSGFVHAEFLVLVSCMAAAGGGLQGVGHPLPAGVSVPILGVRQPRDPALLPAGLLWVCWEHSLDGSIPMGTAGCSCLPGRFPSLLLHNRSHHRTLPFVFKGDFTPWGERGTWFDRFTIVWFVFSTAWAGNQLLRVIYCPNELPTT